MSAPPPPHKVEQMFSDAEMKALSGQAAALGMTTDELATKAISQRIKETFGRPTPKHFNNVVRFPK